MKNILKNSIAVLAIMMIAGTFSSCKKEQNNEIQTGKFILEFEHIWGSGNDMEFNQELVHPVLGDTMKIYKLRYYISNIKLKKTDNTWWSQSESYYLVDPLISKGNLLEISGVPIADYTEIEYTIGVDSIRNVSGAQSGALSAINDMFWSWKSGYIFYKIEGTFKNGTGGNLAYHIGGFSGPTNAIRINSHNLGGPMMIKPTTVPQVHLSVDVSKVFQGTIKPKNISNVMMPGANASIISVNYSGGFEFEHLHN